MVQIGPKFELWQAGSELFANFTIPPNFPLALSQGRPVSIVVSRFELSYMHVIMYRKYITF